MLMPCLLLPVHFDGKEGSQGSLPAYLSRSRLTGIPWTASKQPGTEYWQQEVRIDGFVIGISLWDCKKPISIECQTDEPRAILYYAIYGDIHFETGREQIVILPTGQYGLLVCPANSPIGIRFPAKRHQGIQLSISIHLLQHLSGISAITGNSFGLETGSVQVLAPFLPVTKPIRSIWNRFLFRDSGLQEPDFLQLNEGCLKLLARFNTDWTVARQQQHWKQRKEIRVEELKAYLADHLDVESRALTTETACAKKVGMNMYQFRKFWKEHSGTTLTQYLLQSRMEKARELLLTDKGTPASIYLQVGYQDFSSFSRAFSTWYGYPPSRVKNEDK